MVRLVMAFRYMLAPHYKEVLNIGKCGINQLNNIFILVVKNANNTFRYTLQIAMIGKKPGYIISRFVALTADTIKISVMRLNEGAGLQQNHYPRLVLLDFTSINFSFPHSPKRKSYQKNQVNLLSIQNECIKTKFSANSITVKLALFLLTKSENYVVI